MATLLSLVLSLHLASQVLANPVAAPLITEAARLPIRRRQVSAETDPAWIGYYYDAEDTDSLIWATCEGSQFFTTSGSIVGCCYTGDTAFDCATSLVTSCSGSWAFSALGSEECASMCNTDTVFGGSTADANGYLWIGCNSVEQTFYFQAMPPDTPASTTETPSSTIQISSTSSRATGTFASQTATPSATPEPEKKKSSMAWIAGVVVGVLALIAIVGLAFWMIRNKKKKNAAQNYQAAPQGMQQMPPQYPQQGSDAYAGPPPQGYPSPAPQSYASPVPQAYPTPVPGPMSPYQDNKGFGAPSPQEVQQQQQDWKHNSQHNSWYPQYGVPMQAGAPPTTHNELSSGDLPTSSSVSPAVELPSEHHQQK